MRNVIEVINRNIFHETSKSCFVGAVTTELNKVLNIIYLKFLKVHCCWQLHLN